MLSQHWGRTCAPDGRMRPDPNRGGSRARGRASLAPSGARSAAAVESGVSLMKAEINRQEAISAARAHCLDSLGAAAQAQLRPALMTDPN